jgi:hypothetical protein
MLKGGASDAARSGMTQHTGSAHTAVACWAAAPVPARPHLMNASVHDMVPLVYAGMKGPLTELLTIRKYLVVVGRQGRRWR